MQSYMLYREIGWHHPRIIFKYQTQRRIHSLSLSADKDVASPHQGPVTSLDIDTAECRYLLSGGSDSAIAIYDLQHFNDNNNENTNTPNRRRKIQKKQLVQPIVFMRKGEAHQAGVSAVQWYTIDTGMFFTSSFDNTVKVWDTNLLSKEIMSFNMEHKVYCMSFSPVGISHSVIAVGTADQKGRLCDIRTKNNSHMLLGHREAIWSIKWSPSNEFVLATGSEDKTIRLWDMRKAGCLMALNMNGDPQTNFQNKKFQLNSRETISGTAPVCCAHDGVVNGLSFTHDGLFLLSSGTDNRIRCWNTADGRNTLTTFPSATNRVKTGMQLAVSTDSRVLYHPNGNDIHAYSILSGDLLKVHKAHFERVNSCVIQPATQELFSGSNDRQIICWAPEEPKEEEEQEEYEIEDRDTWSDDD